MPDIADVVIETVADCVDVPPEEISLETHMVADLEADPLVLVDLALRLERRFGLSLERGQFFGPASDLPADADADDWTVQDIVDFIRRRSIGNPEL